MPKSILFLFLLNFYTFHVIAQTTDLSISVEAQNLSGNDISQVHIYEAFQYLITISNSGDSVSNAVFSQTINDNAIILSYVSQNPIGGITLITDFTVANNIINGTINDFPAGASIEIKVIVKAPAFLGGIATNTTITPPSDTTDTNISNNTSIISIDVTDVDIDFAVTHAQISPPEGTPIIAWNDTVTYQITITNNSSIAYPLTNFSSFLELITPQSYGLPNVQLLSVICINATNGTLCANNINVTTTPITISSAIELIFNFDTTHEFTSGGSLTFEMVYQYLDPECAVITEPLELSSHIIIELSHDNISSNTSNSVLTLLIESELCGDTDVCIDTIQINPIVGSIVNWDEEITFETTICNNGPLDAEVLLSLRNISDNVLWQIISIECIASSSSISCSDITFANAGQYWVSNIFNMPIGEVLTIRSVIIFIEPECAIDGIVEGIVRSTIEIMSNDITDNFLNNNFDFDYVSLVDTIACETADIEVTKTQIAPILPDGGSIDNTTSWGMVTYEITVSNLSDEDTFIELLDFMPSPPIEIIGILESIECVSTTGTATCFSIEHANIGIELDGIPDDDDNPDVFWEIIPEDNWLLPAFSSVTFQININWLPECSASAIPATNTVEAYPLEPFIDTVLINNTASVTTFFVPCIDLVVQTFPEFPTVIVNQPFNWVIDITNSITSSNAINVVFEDELDIPFNISGVPTCQITFGNATCITSFNVVGNTISAIIPNMEAGSTVRIFIPVEAPSYGGAFINTAEAIPSPINNEELTPETNISISSVQVIAPTLTKLFIPDEIMTEQESILTFTINNLVSNPSQNNISFVDHLPFGLTISDVPFWEESNGCTATFTGNIGDDFFEVINLTFPDGVESCSFSIPVTSNVAGIYVNNNINFSDQINVDTSLANATLTVLTGDSTQDDCLQIPQVFTPNNDGSNDFLIIPCIEDYPENNIKIFNRYGVLIYESYNYQNNWNGKANKGILKTSNVLPVGTYFYILKANDLPEKITGWVYLNY